MPEKLDVTGAASHPSLPPGFLGSLRQVALVTHDLRKTIDGMLRVGVGPWGVHTFDANTVTDRTYYGRPADFAFKVALAESPGLHWELIQPLEGENIYSDFLSSHGDGLHHLLFNCDGHSWAEKTATFEAAGYTCIQSGRWLGRTTFAYYGTGADAGAILEIVDIAPDWQRPEPEEVHG